MKMIIHNNRVEPVNSKPCFALATRHNLNQNETKKRRRKKDKCTEINKTEREGSVKGEER